MPIAVHSLIGHDLPYRPMCVDWHGLAKMAAKRHRHEQQRKAARHHPLSLADNNKIYFINNTCYFNAGVNYDIKIYYVRLVHYFRGRCRHIGVMALSVMTQQCAIINDALRCHLSSSLLADTALWHPAPAPLHPSSPSSSPLHLLIFGWLLCLPLAAIQANDYCI